MTKETKISLIVGSIVLVGLGIGSYFIFRKKKDLTDADGNVVDGGGTTTTTTTTTTPPKATFNPQPSAEALHKSMDGGGTDDALFWKTSKALSSSEKKQVKAFFSAKYGSLKDWIEGDFMWSDETNALKLWGY